MDSPSSIDPRAADSAGPAHAVLAEVTCSWLASDADGPQAEPTTAVILHASRDMLVLEAADPRRALPPLGTLVHVSGETIKHTGRLAEHGRAGRFLVSLGTRPVRRAVRLRVSLPGVLRCPALPEPMQVEIIDLTTAGARVRGVELPVDSQVALDFTPPGRDQAVTVRALVAHATHGSDQPWIGLIFRLVALRGGR
jgi:hypothetical protein